ncbi:hypothetical protein KJ695_03995 [Patescibacteria group bacterium]|nr:hypothetical protein [Patescibacteria group bacterium]
MNKSELLTKIKGLKQIEPSDSWVVSNKSFIFKYIKTKEAGEKNAFVFETGILKNLGNLFPRLKNSGLASLKPWRSGLAVSAASAAMVLIFGGNFLLAKADGILPGDAFYPFKLAAEKIQLSLTLNEDKRAALTFEFTGNRLNEYYLLTADGSENGASVQSVKIAAENLKTQLNAASTEFEDAKLRLSPEKKVAIAKTVDRKTTDYAKRLKDSGGAKISSNKPNSEVAKIIDKMEEVNTSALTVLATNAGAGGSSDSKEVAVKVGEKIKSLEEKIGLIEQKILAVIVEQEKNNPDAADKSKDNLTSTKLISEAKGILEEAKSALANKDQSKALELVASSDQISKVAEKITDAAATVAEKKKENVAPTAAPAKETPTEIPIPSTRDSQPTETTKDTQPKTEANTVNTAVPAPKAPTEK